MHDGYFLRLPYLEFPDGANVRYIAWPLLIVTGFFNLFFTPIPAMNVGVFLWIVLQGIGAYIIGEKITFSHMGALICGVICMCSTTILQANGNGQFENISMMSLLWLYWALEISEQDLTKGLFHIAISFALTLFSSPYQGVVGLCLIATHLIYTYQWKILLPILPSLLLGGWYYGAVSAGDVYASVTPAHASITESMTLWFFDSTKYC